MLDTIRKHQQSWLTYLIFGAIIVVFGVNFGPGSSSCGSGSVGQAYAAVVDGAYIPQQDFAVMYTQQIEQLRRRAQAGNFELTEEMLAQMGIRERIIDQLIGEALLAREAERLGLRISDEELLAYLDKNYRVAGMNAEDYRLFVERNFRTTIQRFEDRARGELLAQKLAQVIEDNLEISDAELTAAYLRDHDRAMIHYVKLDLTNTTTPAPKAEEIDRLLAEEAKAIDERYKAELGRYRTTEQRRARAIFKALPKDASDAEVARVRSELISYKEQIAAGADFAALAKDHSDNAAQKDNGGDIGWNARGDLRAPLDEALFGLAPLELSAEPLRADDGLYLLQLLEVKPSQQKPLSEVEREVAASLWRERKADELAKASAEKLLAELVAGKKLEELTLAEDEAMTPKQGEFKKPVRYESPWIIRGQEAIARIGIAPELNAAIFTLTPEAPLGKQVFKVGRAYYVVKLKERETPDLEKFAAEKETLRSQALWSKRAQVFQAYVQNLRDRAEVSLNPALFGAGRDG